MFYRHVGLWLDGHYRCNLVLASPQGVKEPWAVITDELPTLQTLWQYALRFRCRCSYFWIANPAQMKLEQSRLRSAGALERLYLVAAVALLYGTSQGKPTCNSPACVNRWTLTGDEGARYLKIGLRWLKGVLHKGRTLLTPEDSLPIDPQRKLCL